MTLEINNGSDVLCETYGFQTSCAPGGSLQCIAFRNQVLAVHCIQCNPQPGTLQTWPQKCRKPPKWRKVEVHQSQSPAPAGSAGTKAGKGLLELGKENDLANQTGKAESLNQ